MSGASQREATQRGATLRDVVRRVLASPYSFSQYATRVPLRGYQRAIADTILANVLQGEGRAFAVMMSRQSGKNELSGQLEAYLLTLYQRRGGQIVKASPTFKPQTVSSILRLSDRLGNPWTAGLWRRREGYVIQLGCVLCLFLSRPARQRSGWHGRPDAGV